MPLLLHRNSCCPVGASDLRISSLFATQVLGVVAIVTTFTGAVLLAPLKSFAPVKVLLPASFAEPESRVLSEFWSEVMLLLSAVSADARVAASAAILLCSVVSAVERVVASVLMLFCNVVSAAVRAVVSFVTAVFAASMFDCNVVSAAVRAEASFVMLVCRVVSAA